MDARANRPIQVGGAPGLRPRRRRRDRRPRRARLGEREVPGGGSARGRPGRSGAHRRTHDVRPRHDARRRVVMGLDLPG